MGTGPAVPGGWLLGFGLKEKVWPVELVGGEGGPEAPGECDQPGVLWKGADQVAVRAEGGGEGWRDAENREETGKAGREGRDEGWGSGSYNVRRK